jgi:predicted DNA-binding transcriptional regulator YafY
MNRLFETVYILLNKKTATAKELAEHFGVSQRTIYRDVDALTLAGIPVYTEQGKGGGISLIPNFVLSKSILSEQEQHEILSALRGLSGIKTADTDQVLQKLSALFNKNTVNWLETDFSNWEFSDREMFNDFKTAILERRIVEFDYFGSSGEKTRRRMEPVRLWLKSRAWYVNGFCLDRQDIRLFKLVRVRNLTVTDERFAERDITTAPPYPTLTSTGHSENIKLKIAPEMTYRVHDEFDENMAKKQNDGSFVVSADWPVDDWVCGKILSFGEYIEVLEPEYLREIIRDKAKKIAEKYRGPR